MGYTGGGGRGLSTKISYHMHCMVALVAYFVGGVGWMICLYKEEIPTLFSPFPSSFLLNTEELARR